MSPASAARRVTALLRSASDPAKARRMQAYMKTDMPFFGVQREDLKQVVRVMVEEYPPADIAEYQTLVETLWALPHREEKYVAISIARGHDRFVEPASLPMYRRMIVEGAWWDLVDDIATHLVRHLVLEYPREVRPVIDEWVEDADLWLRRSAIICQVGAKGRTDEERLFRFCSRRAREKDFFIRKAIGWALREYSKTDPEAVARFCASHRDDLSGLTLREASKYLVTS